ncbi:protein disulfide-isomerase precursor [Pleurotus pulmonarius]|nr:protein disulfide-isomerase precursor [Pleurotus pulmonarius]
MHIRSPLYPSAALVLASLVASSSASDVVNLTALSFETFVRHEPLLLVKFCSWVGHCKALAPHYEAAATALKAKDIKVAEVDCDEDPDFCQAQKVQGYPTLSVFRYGSRTDDYTGIPEADGIINYMVEQSLPAVSVVTAANHEDFQKASNQVVVAVAYLASTTESPAAEFSAIAEKHRDRSAYVFGLSVDKEAMSSAGITPPAIVVYRSFDEPKTMYPSLPLSAFSTPGLEEWILNLSIPVIDEIRAENHAIYVSSTKPLAYLFLDPSSPEKEALIEAIRPIAKKYKPHVNFVWTDAVKFVAHAKALHLTEVKWPALAICSHYAASTVQDLGRGQLAYPLDQSKDVTPEVVEDWLHQFINGKLEPSLRSAPIPETQDEPVITVVGKQFGEIVLDDSKDVFIEFYTTWCGHCKRLKPVWHSLGEKYAPLKDKVTIAKMELIENELPPSAPFRVPGVPAFKFKPAGSREFIDYDGHRSLEDFVAFVQDHARNNLEKPVLSTEGEGVGQILLGDPGARQQVFASQYRMSGFNDIAAVFAQADISLSEFIFQLCTSSASPCLEDLLAHADAIADALMNHPRRPHKSPSWALKFARSNYAAEIRELTDVDNGCHFNAYKITPDQLQSFRIDRMADKMQLLAPQLCDLLQTLLSASDTKQKPSNETSLGHDSDAEEDEMWDQFDDLDIEGLLDVVKGTRMTRAEKKERRRQAILMVKKVVILSLLMQSSNQKANALGSVVGIFLHACRTPEKVVNAISRMGLRKPECQCLAHSSSCNGYDILVAAQYCKSDSDLPKTGVPIEYCNSTVTDFQSIWKRVSIVRHDY